MRSTGRPPARIRPRARRHAGGEEQAHTVFSSVVRPGLACAARYALRRNRNSKGAVCEAGLRARGVRRRAMSTISTV